MDIPHSKDTDWRQTKQNTQHKKRSNSICIGKYISIQEQIVFSLLSDRNISVLPFLK
jgi:hypothetical protein